MLPGISPVMLTAIGASELTYTFVASGTSSVTGITIPASAQAGDLCVIICNARNSDNTNIPTDVTPSGFTNLGGGTGAANSNGFRSNFCVRVLTGGNPGSSVSTMNDNTIRAFVLVFRPSVPINTPTLVGAIQYTVANGDPTAQAVTPTNGDVPYIAVGTCFADNAGTFSTSPAGYTNVEISANQHVAAYRIVNSGSASTESCDITDTGNWNALMMAVIKATPV
jgi:hypothetical protein